jgi:hypothetical protein
MSDMRAGRVMLIRAYGRINACLVTRPIGDQGQQIEPNVDRHGADFLCAHNELEVGD